MIIEWPLAPLFLDTSHWPDTLDNLNTYGAKEIEVLKEHFRQLLHENGTNVDAIRGKWLDAKVGIHRSQVLQIFGPPVSKALAETLSRESR